VEAKQMHLSCFPRGLMSVTAELHSRQIIMNCSEFAPATGNFSNYFTVARQMATSEISFGSERRTPQLPVKARNIIPKRKRLH